MYNILVVLASASTNTLIESKKPVKSQIRHPIAFRLTTIRRRMVVEHYELGLSTRAVATKNGVSKTTVLSILHQAGVRLRPQGGHHGSD